MVDVYTTAYSQVAVYESIVNGFQLMRRCDDDWVNATQIMKIAGFGKPQRTRALEREVHKLVHRKVQGGHGKFQGTWVPLEVAKELAMRHNIPRDQLDVLYYNAESDPPVPPKDSKIVKQLISNSSIKTDERKRLLKIDTKSSNSSESKNSSTKLTSPQKAEKNNNILLRTTQPFKELHPTDLSKNPITSTPISNKLNMPPTFGMFDTKKRALHSKSKSVSNLPSQLPELATPRSNVKFSSSNPSSAVHNVSYYHQPVQNHQLEIQQELQMLQKQQQQQVLLQQRQQNHYSQLQRQQQQQPQKPQRLQNFQYSQNLVDSSQTSISQSDSTSQYFLNNHNNPNIHNLSMASISDELGDDSNNSMSSQNNSQIQYGLNLKQNNMNYLHPRYQQYTTSGDTELKPPFTHYRQQNIRSQHLLQSHHHPHSAPIVPNYQNVFETPTQMYRHQRHHSSPHIINQLDHQLEMSVQNSNSNSNIIENNLDSITNQVDNNEFYTNQLIGFFAKNEPVPEFLFNPPSDFNINLPIDDEGHTPLHWASALAVVDIIKLLIEHNADPLSLNNSGMNPLTKLIHYNNAFNMLNFNLILPLLKDCVVVPDGNNRTPIHYLVELSNIENKGESSHYYFDEIILFIKLQQKEAEKLNKNSNTTIRQILPLLINHEDLNGETALHLAIKENSNSFIIKLIKNGADVTKVGLNNLPPEILKQLPLFDDGNEYNDNVLLPLTPNQLANDYNNDKIDELDQQHNLNSQAGDKNPFLVQKLDSRINSNTNNSINYDLSKATPQTIVLQRTPDSVLESQEDKENIFHNLIVEEIENSKLFLPNVTSTPSVKVDVDQQTSITLDKKEKNNDEENIEELLKISPSSIEIDKLDNFVSVFPSLISQLKNALHSKDDEVKYNIETINKLNHEIKTLTSKNSKLLKRIYKVSNNNAKSTPNINASKIANSSNENINDFVSLNISKVNNLINEKYNQLHQIYERSQALDVAKLVRDEESAIFEGQPINQNKLELAITLTLLQIKRRKIIQQTLESYLDESMNNDDFHFDESTVDTNIASDSIDEYRMMKSKVIVYKKLISKICGLPQNDINNDLLNEIEKMLT